MAIGNMDSKFGKGHAFGSGDILANRQTDRQAHRHIITIPCNRSRGRSN